MEKISIWNDTGNTGSKFSPLIGNITAETVIVGGGITAVMTAYMLVQKGKNCVLIESLDIAGGTTSHSTGNLYCMVDEKLQKVRSKFDANKAKSVAQSRQATVDFIEQLVEQHHIECDFLRVPFYCPLSMPWTPVPAERSETGHTRIYTAEKTAQNIRPRSRCRFLTTSIDAQVGCRAGRATA